MLQLLEQRPDLRGWVKQLHLAMPPSTYYFEDLAPGQIQSLWEQVESKYGVKILGREEVRDDSSRFTDERGYGILLALLLSVLRGVEGLSVFSTAGTFAHAGNYLTQNSTLLTQSNQLKGNDYTQEISPTTILPNLTSLAVTNQLYNDVELQPNITTWSSMAVLDVCPNLSKVWADGFYDSPPLGNLPNNVCQNITALNLMNTFISEDAFPALMERIQCLETFKFLVMEPDCGSLLDDEEYGVLSPRAAVRGLQCHAKSLRTFYYQNDVGYFGKDELFDTFEAFASLKNLWIDTKSFTTTGGAYGMDFDAEYSDSEDGTDTEQDDGPQNLPGLPCSLRRLYISEDIEPIVDSLRLLASECELRFPKLEKVVFGEPYLLDGPGFDEMGLNEIYRTFRNAGVEACPHDKYQSDLW
ncbi:hypothetical protein CkaCkLH20_10662 [Colletotrichum karsti]|uniref:Uncharacterized protein n=1 Tax=Colletotrichum karsti TaxID=1095194 RepID=A0A9P6HVT3_9PEZI|nr:uncharacterized protein CkaCkLH20_10662 [Colletotrichum karsti]KAF9871728.1 hypothetical protein CkaCkLH20_10662 [Colletotrichum karsti]